MGWLTKGSLLGVSCTVWVRLFTLTVVVMRVSGRRVRLLVLVLLFTLMD